MNLTDKINQDLKEAMKAKNAIALRGIRAVKAAILLANTDGSGEDLDKEKEIKLLQKLVKQRKDSYDIYVKQGREDLAVIEKEEIEIIEKYLPSQMSEDELKSAIQDIIQSTGASSMKDMGMVMGQANKQFAGKADGKTIATIIKALLA